MHLLHHLIRYSLLSFDLFCPSNSMFFNISPLTADELLYYSGPISFSLFQDFIVCDKPVSQHQALYEEYLRTFNEKQHQHFFSMHQKEEWFIFFYINICYF